MSIETHFAALTRALELNTLALNRYVELRERELAIEPQSAAPAEPEPASQPQSVAAIEDPKPVEPAPTVSVAEAFKASAAGKDTRRGRPPMISPNGEQARVEEPVKVDPPKMPDREPRARPAAPEGVQINILGLAALDGMEREKRTANLIYKLHGHPVTKDEAEKVLTIYVAAGTEGSDARKAEIREICQSLPLIKPGAEGGTSERVSSWPQVHESQAGEIVYQLGQRLDIYPTPSAEIF